MEKSMDRKPAAGILALLFALPALLVFEGIYKLITAVVIRPVINWIFLYLLKKTGTQVAFNEGVLTALTRLPGLIAFIICVILIGIFVYYEFAVIFIYLYHRINGRRLPITEAAKLAVPSLRSLKNTGLIGFTVYGVGLLPLMHLGLCPTILSRTTVPRFITGELMKTLSGKVLVIAVFLVFVFFFFRWLFVLPGMVLGHMRFGKARKFSVQVIRKGGNGLLIFCGVFFLIWVVLFLYPKVIPDYFPGITGAGPIDLIQYVFTRHTVVPMLACFFAWMLRIALSTVLISFLIKWYCHSGGTVEIVHEALPGINRRLAALNRTAVKSFRVSMEHLIPALNRAKRSAFVQRHRKKLMALSGVLMVLGLFYIFYSPGPLQEPTVIGHRGSEQGVENTIEAVLGAADAGADYAEMDILLSKDNVPMVVHDSNLKRLTGEDVNVGDLTAEELQQLTLNVDGKTGKIATLDEMLSATEGKINLLIELKEHGQETEDVARKTGEVIEKHHAGDRCIFMSLNYDLVMSLKRWHPDYTVGYCVYSNVGKLSTAELRDLGVDFLTIEENMVSKDFIDKCTRAWLPVYVWTVDNPENMKAYLETGACGIITDKPELCREVVDSLG